MAVQIPPHAFWASFSHLLTPLGLSQSHCIEKFEKQKTRKSRLLASQTPSKILPKTLQTQYPKKHAIFHGFLVVFGCLLHEPNLKFHAPTQCFVNFSQKSSVRFWHAFRVRKNLPKTIPKQGPNLLKIDAKNVLFFNIVFRVRAPILEPLGFPSPPRCWQRQAC